MNIERIGTTGPKFVMIHGWAMQTAMFEPMVTKWRNTAQIILVDLPGHGRSRADDTSLSPMDKITETLKNEVGDDAIWLGWSMGGLFALQCATKNARAYIGLSTSPCFTERTDWPYGLSTKVLENMKQSVENDAHRTVKEFLQLEVLGVSRKHPSLKGVSEEAFAHGDPQPKALQEGLDLLEHVDLRHEVKALEIPNLWIGGSRDRLVNPKSLEASAALNQHGECVIIQGAGHAAFISAPDILIEHIEQFGAEHDLGLV